jgi:ribonuclease HI
MIKVYVDGTFYNGKYGGGYVVYENNKIIYQDCGIGKNDPELLSMRNIAGEMTAAMRATNWLDCNFKSGVIIHDYNGLAHWAKKEWKRNNKYTQMYADFMNPFYVLGIIDFQWVKGHTKVEGNEIADRLAKQSVLCNQQWKF